MSENSKLTRESILALEAGREIDRLIHHQVMQFGEGGTIVKYSTDLNWCREMELVVRQRYLLHEYLTELKTLCWEAKVEMPLADALTRCKAALLCVMEESNA